jgi:metal-responsive CopG/Arc/MetJ family transcriptional regulator
MRVAVSIPEEVFAETEDLVKRLGASRSENVSLTVALDRQVLTDRVRKIPCRRLELVFAGIDTILGR